MSQEEKIQSGLFGSIVDSVFTPGATSFDVGVIHFAFISLIALLAVIFAVTDRAKIHVAIFLLLAVITYGLIIWFLYFKDYSEDTNEKEAKKTENYNPKFTYGVYQISTELNTSHKIEAGGSIQTVYDYPELNSYLVTLRIELKTYFQKFISKKLFKYQLIK